jgi:cellulose synthase/poly-beta-1,6-N-acetylglucosamine synthase-like glycosyltransferase
MEQLAIRENIKFKGKSQWWNMVGKMALFLIAGVITFGLYHAGHFCASYISNSLFTLKPIAIPMWISRFFSVYYLIFIVGTVFPFSIFYLWMLVASYRANINTITPFVSVIIPAFNEESNILQSLKAAMELDYPVYEIIVVDDGSVDFTMPIIEKSAVKCIKLRQNRGKSAALNEGIKRAMGDIVVFSDSDSIFHRDSIRHLVRHFIDPEVGAVAGKVVLSETPSFLSRFQALEYIFGQNMIKLAQLGSSSSVTICPGPICAYRRKLLISMNGFKNRTVAEDFDATLDIINQNFRVAYEPLAIAYTKAPKTWADFKKQRMRWSRGTLQVLKYHRKLMFDPSKGSVGMFWLPYFLVVGYGVVVFELLTLFIAPLLMFASGEPLACLKIATGYIVLIELFSVFQYFVTLLMEKKFKVDLVLSAFIIQPYRFFLNWIKLIVITHEIRRKAPKWSC